MQTRVIFICATQWPGLADIVTWLSEILLVKKTSLIAAKGFGVMLIQMTWNSVCYLWNTSANTAFTAFLIFSLFFSCELKQKWKSTGAVIEVIVIVAARQIQYYASFFFFFLFRCTWISLEMYTRKIKKDNVRQYWLSVNVHYRVWQIWVGIS